MDTTIATTEQVHATFEPASPSVAAARRFIRRTLLGWGAAAVIDDALLLVSELVTNAVVHAGTQTDVTCSRYDGGIQVDVLDRYPARGLPAVLPVADPMREGGRGLHLSSVLASAWGVEYTRTTKRVWFRLETPGMRRDVRDRAGERNGTGEALGQGVGKDLGDGRGERRGDRRGDRWGAARDEFAGGGLHVAALLLDAGGAIRQWSPEAAALFGWREDEVRGRDLAELLAWPERPGGPASLAEALTHARWQGEYEVRHAEGWLVPVFASHLATARDNGETGVACLLVPRAQRALIEAPPAPPTAPPESRAEDSRAEDSRADDSRADDSRADRSEWAGLADAASARMGLDDLLQRVVERVRDGMGGDAAFVMLATDDEAELEVRSTAGLPATVRRFTRLPLEGMAGRVASPRLPLVQADVGDEARAAPYLRGTGMRAVLTVPLLFEGRLTGILGVAAERPGRFGNDDAVRLTAAAERIALPVESARLAELYRVRRGWVSFLAEASDLLAGTLDPQQTLAIVAQLVVPRLAEWCAVYIVEPGHGPRLTYVWHQDETRIDVVRSLLERAPEPEQRTMPGARPWTGLSVPSAGAARTVGDAVGDTVRDTVIALPLLARGHSLGTLLLGRPPGDRFRRDVLDLAEDLSRRAALALDNARLYSERTATSQALQRSLLPPELPDVPGLEVGVVYQAAGEGNDVGGDFYDLFAIDEARWGFAIGDVCGTGAEAAAVTGLARHTLRILGRSGYPVPEVLTRLNTAIIGEGPRSRFLTLLYGEISPADAPEGGMRLTLVSAGHPLPLRLRPDGTACFVGTPQPLLGVLDHLELTAETVYLPPGDVLVCVTDGVTERRGGGRMLDEDGFARVVADCVGLGANTVAARLHRAVLGFVPEPPRDDLAVLVFRAV